MNKLIHLELKKSNLRPYHFAVIVISITMLGLLYLFASIPRLDPTETDIDMFQSYNSLTVLLSIITTAIFAILSAVMHAKMTVEEYTGKQSILLFLYPLKKTKIIDAKICFITLYTIITMFGSCVFIYGIFFITEMLFPISTDTLTLSVIVNSLLIILCNALIAGLMGIVSLWVGFLKKSAIATIVSSCILVSIISQISAISLENNFIDVLFLPVLMIVAIIASKSLHAQVNQMEV